MKKDKTDENVDLPKLLEWIGNEESRLRRVAETNGSDTFRATANQTKYIANVIRRGSYK